MVQSNIEKAWSILSSLRLNRILEYLFTVVIVLSLNFLLPRLLPGNPLVSLARGSIEDVSSLSDKQVEYYLSFYGLDKPLGEQYLAYLNDIIHLDFGKSIIYNISVVEFVFERIQWTLLLMGCSLLLSAGLGVLLGAVSAYHRNQFWDRNLYFGMLSISEVPSFIIGIIFLMIFSLKLKLFPVFGAYTYYTDFSNPFAYISDITYHAVLPVLTLTVSRIGMFYFISRNSVITVLGKDYIRTAKAKGLPRRNIILGHALRNAMLPVVTRIFLSIGSLIGGTILVENVFSYPGLGVLMREAVADKDYPLIQGLFLFVTLLTLTANLLADLVYKRLDPRVR